MSRHDLTSLQEKAVYDDVLARTGDEAEAVWQAKEVMNFARRGAHPVMRVIDNSNTVLECSTARS